MRIMHLLKKNPFAIIFILFLSVVCYFAYRYNTLIGILFTITFIGLIGCWIIWTVGSFRRTETALSIYAENLRYEKKKTNDRLCNPFPVIVTDKKGKIEWYNSLFDDIIDEFDENLGDNINTIIESAADNVTDIPHSCKGQTKEYSVYPFDMKNSLIAWFFVDDTGLKYTEKRYNLTRPVALFITIDSLESSEDALKHVDYTSFVSQVESKVFSWLDSYHCAFRKYSEGKFFAVTEVENYSKMKEDGFTILEDARAVNDNTDAEEITLTIGIGKGNNFTSSENAAKDALNVARGRGGDQVVSKIDGNYSNYGGKTLIKERLSRVAVKQAVNLLDDRIEASENIYIMGHAFSDFDSLGSAVAIAETCRAANKRVCVYFNKYKTLALPLYNYLIENGCDIDFVDDEKLVTARFENSLLIVVDTITKHLVDCPLLLEKCKTVAVVDHHRITPETSIETQNLIHDSNASSACELATEISEYSKFNPSISPAVATALLCGILLDTKNFSLRSGMRTFETAAYLKNKYASTVDARTMFSISPELSVNKAKVLENTEFHNNCAISFCEVQNEDVRVISSKAADELLDINNVDASFVIFSTSGKTMISARSLGKTNVQTIMEKLGGGGHSNMAACQLGDISFNEAKKLLIDAIDNKQ